MHKMRAELQGPQQGQPWLTAQLKNIRGKLYAGTLICSGAAQAMPRGGLAYFNCGAHSGASQPHKHTQVVPLPLVSAAELAGASADASPSGRDAPGEEALQLSAAGSPGGLRSSGTPAGAAEEAARQAGPAGGPAGAAPPGRSDAAGWGAGTPQQQGEPAQGGAEMAAGEAAVAPLLQAAADAATRGAGAAAYEPRAARLLPFRCFCAALPEQCAPRALCTGAVPW